VRADTRDQYVSPRIEIFACAGFGYDFNKRRLFDLTRVR